MVALQSNKATVGVSPGKQTRERRSENGSYRIGPPVIGLVTQLALLAAAPTQHVHHTFFLQVRVTTFLLQRTSDRCVPTKRALCRRKFNHLAAIRRWREARARGKSRFNNGQK